MHNCTFRCDQMYNPAAHTYGNHHMFQQRIYDKAQGNLLVCNLAHRTSCKILHLSILNVLSMWQTQGLHCVIEGVTHLNWCKNSNWVYHCIPWHKGTVTMQCKLLFHIVDQAYICSSSACYLWVLILWVKKGCDWLLPKEGYQRLKHQQKLTKVIWWTIFSSAWLVLWIVVLLLNIL